MPQRKIRFGIHTPLVVDWQQTLDFWRFIEDETRFDSAWTFDHFVQPMPWEDPMGECLEGWTALAALAQATKRLRLGCLVSGVTYRYPSVLAKMAATVDHISNGRLEFGLGAAWHEAEHNRFGIPFPPLAERLERLDEAAELIHTLFHAEGTASFEGRYYRLENAPFCPPPLQQPHPPILIGGGGEKRTLRTVARFSDISNVFGPPPVVTHKFEILDGHCRDIGRDPADIERSVFTPIVLTDRQDVIDRNLQALPDQGLTLEELRDVSPVGSVEHVRESLRAYIEAGVTYFIAMSHGPYDFDYWRRVSEEIVAPLVEG